MKRIDLPKKVLITGGMPNGNKDLHLGHISCFIFGDFYARYMRDRIGEENVIYICGTDGYGSSTDEKYRRLKEAGKISETLPEYVTRFNKEQKYTIDSYLVSLNDFYASCLPPAKATHEKMSAYFFDTLKNNGKLQKKETLQFFDTKLGVFLNGRQVSGRCPIEGCESEEAYADECALGHQFDPTDLIDPISNLSKTKPELRKITNYYFPLDEYRNYLLERVQDFKDSGFLRKFMLKEMRDYLTRPQIFVSSKEKSKFDKVKLNNVLNNIFDEKKDRIELTFSNVVDRDEACEILHDAGIRYSTNKTLAPLRITGNTPWGVPVPAKSAGSKDLTFYVWPESLWAPLSFTDYYLTANKKPTKWQDWWCNKDTQIVQFIGEDNIYFYCLAQQAMFVAMNNDRGGMKPNNGDLQPTTVIANKHILWGGKKASSSGALPPPMARDLLEHYTPEQVRCYFLSTNVHSTATEFKSKVYNPVEYATTGDPFLAPSAMLNNIFNRLIRSVFYSYQSMLDNKLPKTKPSKIVVDEATKVCEEYQDLMGKFDFANVMILLDKYFRKANQDWVVRSKKQDTATLEQLIADSIHIIKTGVLLVHPLAPASVENLVKYLNADKKLFDWNNVEKTFFDIYPKVEKFKFIEAHFDFFKKHISQV
ncbi:MAG: class I tRNA ligase family protein [Clostridia bacterium]|nr:class I tRNA ligase family protein [Clostridia bacterium]